MKLRRFNETGITHFDQFRDAPLIPLGDLPEILVYSAWSAEVEADIEVEQRQFDTRFELGAFLNSLFADKDIAGLDNDVGIWTWMAAFYFAELRPENTRPGARARWVPAVGDFRKYYRHLLAGPYQVYRAHRENPRRVLAVLANPPHRPGDIAEQLTARQELVTNGTVMEVATRLYIDPDTETPKSGAASIDNGSARRLAAVLNQLELTWDLYTLTSEQLLDLLPQEFDRFRT